MTDPPSFAICCSFLWIENFQQLLGGTIQNIVVITGDQSVMVLILLVAIWTCYWLWRIGRDIVGKGGWVAVGFIALSFLIDVALLYMLQARLLNHRIINTTRYRPWAGAVGPAALRSTAFSMFSRYQDAIFRYLQRIGFQQCCAPDDEGTIELRCEYVSHRRSSQYQADQACDRVTLLDIG